MNEIILKYVLKNQYEYGSVNPKAVLGMVLREKPELKKDVPLVLKEIEAVTAKNSSLSKKEIKSRLEKIDSYQKKITRKEDLLRSYQMLK